MPTNKPLSWRPRRRGKVYCAPACGGGCKWVDNQAAWREARELARVMGRGWRPEVWENLGWHWRIKLGECELHAYPGERYWCSLMAAGWQFQGEHTTPKGAFNQARRAARRSLKAIQATLHQLGPEYD